MKVDAGARKREMEANGYNTETGDGDLSGRAKQMDRTDVNYTASVVGTEKWESSKGTTMMHVRFVCVDCRDRVSGDVVQDQIGRVLTRDYAITEKAVGFFTDLIVAYGYDGAFDPESKEEIDEIFANSATGLVRFRLKKRDYPKRDGSTGTAYEPERYFQFPAGVDYPPNVDEIIEEAAKGFDKYLEWREQHPRGQRQGGGGGGGYRQGGGGGGGHEGGVDDDLPF